MRMIIDLLCFVKMKRGQKLQLCMLSNVWARCLFSPRCGSSWHLQSGREEHGPFGSAGMGRRTDRTDINHLLFKDPRHALRFLWKCLTSLKETDVQILWQRHRKQVGMKLYKVEGAGQNVRPGAVWQDCPLVFTWLHYRTAPYVPCPRQGALHYVKPQDKAPCSAANQVNIGVESSFLTVLC